MRAAQTCRFATLSLIGCLNGIVGEASGAQIIESLAIFPPPPVAAGAPLSLTIHAANPFDSPCGLRLNFGDGRKLRSETMGGPGKATFPLTMEIRYPRAGNFRIRADGVRVGKAPPCRGSASIAVAIRAPAR